MLRYGGPSGLQMLVEVAGFTLFLLVVGNLGNEAMAATTLAFNVNMPGIRTDARVGHGLEHPGGATTGPKPSKPGGASHVDFALHGLGYMGTMALVYVLLPNVLLMGHEMGIAGRPSSPSSPPP